MSIDFTLKCNNLKCRKSLDDSKACITSCSHIFCTKCANKAFSIALICPACESNLPEKNDIILSNLKPNETFKNSALAGLHPDLIMEICSKGLSFWSYQVTQELYCQEIIAKNLGEKKALTEKQLKEVINSANSEITLLQKKINGLLKAKELERKKHSELANHYSEKTRQFIKLQSLYDKLKRRQVAMSTKNSVNANFYHEPAILQSPKYFTPHVMRSEPKHQYTFKPSTNEFQSTQNFQPQMNRSPLTKSDRLTLSTHNSIGNLSGHQKDMLF